MNFKYFEDRFYSNMEHIISLPAGFLAYVSLNISDELIKSLFAIGTAVISTLLITYTKHKYQGYLEKKKKKNEKVQKSSNGRKMGNNS